ncbi:TetR/AcrR family transcriptional regulator [Sneathiella aquimaris]|uniref:TetR/AcrR family transcriptional regulator n=1 Tax=Sneathiella aquimaris TaxID=2599305 RepID=UPI00146F5D83|nr:TetR/AcrR family transcriptional regulator [Sneathiella aquimaris]
MVTDEDIIEATITTLAHKPEATMQEIAREAGVSRITINRRFGSRNDLLQIAATYSLDLFEDILLNAQKSRKPPLDQIRQIFEGYAGLSNHYFFWMRGFVEDRKKYETIFLNQLAMVEKLVLAAQDRGELRKDLPTGWIAGMFDYLAITVNSSLNRGVIAQRDALNLGWDTFLNGVSPKKFF